MNTPAFLTGSHAYGTPTADSDVDLVVRVTDAATLADLLLCAEVATAAKDKPASAVGLPQSSYRFGRLNIILCHTDRQYADWRDGTALLIASRPVTRDRAVEVFRQMRARDDNDVFTEDPR